MKKMKVAVIGSGFGGLSAALRLQALGFDVTIFERRDKPGGRAYVYEDKGFTFDAGPTVITAPNCLEELFELSGRNMKDYVELLPVNPMYRLLWEDGYAFDYTKDLDETLEQIRKKNPADAEGYRRFLEYSKKVFDKGYTELAHRAFLNLWSMLRVAPDLLKLKAYKSVYQTVASFVKDEKLREAFSFHPLLVGGNPFNVSSIYTLIHFLERNWGVYFPRGGTGALVSSLVKVFEEQGGKLKVNSPVEEIVTAEGKVRAIRTATETESFDLVVSNACVYRTYSKLLARTPEARSSAESFKRRDYSMSLFVIYFGTKRQYPNIAHHSVIFGPRYKGLLNDIFKNGVLADDFSLYLHAPTRTDSSLAPAGGEAFYVLSPVPHLGKLDIDWNVVGPQYADRILRYLEERHLPGLRDSIVTQRILTPLDFDRELDSHLGAGFSLAPTLTQSAYFRTPNRDPKIEGLYFVGAGTHPGAGVPGVVGSAKATAQVIADDFGLAYREPVRGVTPQSARTSGTTAPFGAASANPAPSKRSIDSVSTHG